MPYRTTTLVNNEIYHIYNRGIEKRNIFLCKRDHQRCLDTFSFYQYKNNSTKFSLITHPMCNRDNYEKRVEVICYCLMPNHMHFVLEQITNNGISDFMRLLGNSYVKYFNLRYDRAGTLFQGQFKAKHIDTDEQLAHLSRYVHLNPYVSGLVNNLGQYYWSSFNEYAKSQKIGACEKKKVLQMFKNNRDYIKFVKDHKDYAKNLEMIKYMTIDYEKIY